MDQVPVKEVRVEALHARPSVFTIAFRLLTMELITGVLLVAILWLLALLVVPTEVRGVAPAVVNSSYLPGLLGSYAAVILVIGIFRLVLILWLALGWVNKNYQIHADHVVSNRGFLVHTSKVTPIKDINRAELNQGTLGRIFNFGSISLLNKDAAVLLRLRDIHNPKRYLEIFTGMIASNNSNGEV